MQSVLFVCFFSLVFMVAMSFKILGSHKLPSRKILQTKFFSIRKLSDNDSDLAVKTLNGWTKVKDRDAIAKSYQFGSFVECFGFMSQCGEKVHI